MSDKNVSGGGGSYRNSFGGIIDASGDVDIDLVIYNNFIFYMQLMNRCGMVNIQVPSLLSKRKCGDIIIGI